MTFQIGDKVKWTSSSCGSTKTKRGEIVEVLPPGRAPGTASANRYPGMPRDHESYLVRAVADGRRGARVYWPRVAALMEDKTK